MASIEDVATALGGAVTSNIRGAQDYQQAMGTLNATIGAGNMRMDELIGALGTGVLPAAKNAGLSLTEVGAALAVLTDRGMSADMAGTRLRMTFALMQSPSKKAVNALADMGVNANSMAATLRKPDGLLKVLQMLHDGMTSVGAVRGSKDILGAFGGGRSGAGILTLIQSLDSAVSSYQGKVTQIQATSGKLADSEVAQQKTAAAQFHKDLAAMEADLTKLGGAMLPTVSAIANGVTDIAAAFGHLPAPVKHDLGVIVALLAIGGPLLLAGIGVTKMIRTIGRAFSLLPAEAAPGIAATGVELETGIGGAAITANAEVSTLRASLLGLGALAIAPIVIPIEYDFAKSKYNPLRGPLERAGATLAGPSGAGPSGPGAQGFAEAISGARRLMAQYGTNYDHAGPAEREAAGKLMQRFPSIAADQWASIWRIVSAHPVQIVTSAGGAGEHGALATNGASAATTTSFSTDKAVPLTAQQKLQDELIAHPKNIEFLKQQAAQDKSVVAFAEKLRNEGRMDNTRFQTIYKQYMADLVSTEETITQVETTSTSKRVAAAKKRVAEAKAARAKIVSEAEQSERVMVADAKAAVDRAKVTRGTIKDDELALYNLIAVYGHEANDKVLPADRRATARQDRAATQQQLAALRDQYTVPLAFQLEDARAQATNNLAGMVDAAKKTKAAALKAIHDGTLSMQGMIAAWNVVDTANQTIGQQNLANYKAVSAIKITAGLGLTGRDRRVAEARYAQALAHGGRVPGGPAAFGVPLAPIQVHSTVLLDGREIAKTVTTHQQRADRRTVIQVRGRNAGRPT
jgi:TP901 family phage tail tape measure protein